MCTQNSSIKLICATCFFIMVVDSVVLHQTLLQWQQIQRRSDPYVFHQCYQPQIMMRIIFTCYAINAATLCFILTLALAFFSDYFIERCAAKLFTYTYILFGPVLLICCLYGWIDITGLVYECEPSRISHTINFMDVFILIGCTVFAFCISFLFSMHKIVEHANEALRDENSVFYRVFMFYLKHKRSQLLRSQQAPPQEQRQQSNYESEEPQLRIDAQDEEVHQSINIINSASRNSNEEEKDNNESKPLLERSSLLESTHDERYTSDTTTAMAFAERTTDNY